MGPLGMKSSLEEDAGNERCLWEAPGASGLATTKRRLCSRAVRVFFIAHPRVLPCFTVNPPPSTSCRAQSPYPVPVIHIHYAHSSTLTSIASNRRLTRPPRREHGLIENFSTGFRLQPQGYKLTGSIPSIQPISLRVMYRIR
jgi:hypothetical protein